MWDFVTALIKLALIISVLFWGTVSAAFIYWIWVSLS